MRSSLGRALGRFYVWRYTFRARQATRSNPGYSFTQDFVSERVGNWSEHLAALVGKPEIHCLEIGSYEGRSSVWFLEQVLTHPTATLTCVDPRGPETPDGLRFAHNIAVTGVADKVTTINGRSEDLLSVAPIAEMRFDFAYIDGGHEAPHVLFDAVFTWPLLKPDAILIFDDYLWKPELPVGQRPKIAIDKFLDDYAGQYDMLENGYQVVIRKR